MLREAGKVSKSITVVKAAISALYLADAVLIGVDCWDKVNTAKNEGKSTGKALAGAIIANTADYGISFLFSYMGEEAGAAIGSKFSPGYGTLIGSAIGGFAGGTIYSLTASDFVYNSIYGAFTK
jgi:hypothetical protein